MQASLLFLQREANGWAKSPEHGGARGEVINKRETPREELKRWKKKEKVKGRPFPFVEIAPRFTPWQSVKKSNKNIFCAPKEFQWRQRSVKHISCVARGRLILAFAPLSHVLYNELKARVRFRVGEKARQRTVRDCLERREHDKGFRSVCCLWSWCATRLYHRKRCSSSRNRTNVPTRERCTSSHS